MKIIIQFFLLSLKSTILQDGRHEKRTLRLRNGLITRHAYSVTGLARVRGQLGKNFHIEKFVYKPIIFDREI